MIVQQQPPKAIAISFTFFISFLNLVVICMTTLLALVAQQLKNRSIGGGGPYFRKQCATL